MNPALWVWVLSRLLWGASYSALRFSSIQYAANSNLPGSALGIGRTIQEAGPFLAYWIGPLMLSRFGQEYTFTSWALILFLLLPVFRILPDINFSHQDIKPFTCQRPTWIDAWNFALAFIVEGLLVVGIVYLINPKTIKTDEIVFMTAIYISIRRLMNMLVSPFSGWLSDRMGFNIVFQISCLIIPFGLISIGMNQIELGIILAFLGSAINYTSMPMIAFHSNPLGKSMDSLTRMSTSRDVGSAVGSLTGLGILSLMEYQIVFLILSILILLIYYKIYKTDISVLKFET